MADESGVLSSGDEYKENNDAVAGEMLDTSLKPTKELRHKIGRQVKSVKKFMLERYEKELKEFLDVFRGDIESILPPRIANFENVDVNIVYPVIKTLVPSLYFQDPKVFIKAEQEKIVFQFTDPMTGQPMMDEMTGMPKIEEISAVESATKFQALLNFTIRQAKLKREMKSALTDAELCYYGAIKSGWDNEQGVESMGEGAPPSHRDDTDMDMPYGIRRKPWKVYVDMEDFYHPKWIAESYEVHPEQLKKDKRLQNTEKLEGNFQIPNELKETVWKELQDQDLKRTEVFECYIKPCAEYPNGVFCMFTDEVPDDFLYFGEWPYSKPETRKTFPIKIIYFNEDPDGGLPVPGIRYYLQQQRAKSVLRRVMFEYVQRTLPIMGVDETKASERAKQGISSGSLPRIVAMKGNPNSTLAGISFSNLNQDFYNMDTLLDDDVSRLVGVADSGGRGQNVKFAEVAKQAEANQQVRNSEKADIVRDFMIEIVRHWMALYQEFGTEEMSTPMEGEQFPIKLSVDELQAKFTAEIKPFSMNYEDPMILRRQWVDLLNIFISPAMFAALTAQGALPDIVRMAKRVLLTYDDPETHSYIIDQATKAENQVADALNENNVLMAGQPTEVLPTDNHQVHIMIHGMMPNVPGKLEHMEAHQQAMLAKAGMAPSKPGGGNPEGLPVKGNAASQEMMDAPLEPSPMNQSIALNREGLKPIETR